MNCLDNNVVWVNAYWTRMSHQRSLDPFKYGVQYKVPIEFNPSIKEKDSKKRRGNDRGTLHEEYKESLNPMTKDWRESLRGWENISFIGRTTRKVHWAKKQKSYLSKK